MELRLVTREDFFPGEAEEIRLMFELGLDWLHLRKPGASEDEYRAFLLKLSPLERSRTVLHEHYHLAPELGAGGIHANSRHPFPESQPGVNSRNTFPCALKLSASCHSLEELASRRQCFDHLFLSPIFDSISKAGYASGFTREQLLEAKHKGLIDNKIIALGGITYENIPIIRELGFGGVAVLGSVWLADSPLSAFEKLRAITRG